MLTSLCVFVTIIRLKQAKVKDLFVIFKLFVDKLTFWCYNSPQKAVKICE